MTARTKTDNIYNSVFEATLPLPSDVQQIPYLYNGELVNPQVFRELVEEVANNSRQSYSHDYDGHIGFKGFKAWTRTTANTSTVKRYEAILCERRYWHFYDNNSRLMATVSIPWLQDIEPCTLNTY